MTGSSPIDAPIVVIGAGQGGLQAAESVRKEKFEGDILLIGDEPHAPYNRPPLSKGLLLGEVTQEQLTIRNPAAMEKKNITLKTGVRVQSLDPAAHTLTLADGTVQPYAKLVLATGSRARPLPVDGADLGGVHMLRTLDDTLAIQAEMTDAQRVVVIGGGFIGLEMAAVARKMGKDVVVVEAADRLMGRVVSPFLSDHYYKVHTDHGVDVRLGAMVAGLKGAAGKVTAVSIKDGDDIAADLVVMGVGILPNTELADAAGIECDGGIVVDNCGRTSDPDVFAIGDCTAMRQADGSLRRLESVQNAVELAKSAAAAIQGVDKPFVAAPWFWSDQYDLKLQMVGLSQGFDEQAVRGSVEDNAFSVFYFKGGKLVSIDSINDARTHMVGRKLVASETCSLTPAQAADEDFDLATAV